MYCFENLYYFRLAIKFFFSICNIANILKIDSVFQFVLYFEILIQEKKTRKSKSFNYSCKHQYQHYWENNKISYIHAKRDMLRKHFPLYNYNKHLFSTFACVQTIQFWTQSTKLNITKWYSTPMKLI